MEYAKRPAAARGRGRLATHSPFSLCMETAYHRVASPPRKKTRASVSGPVGWMRATIRGYSPATAQGTLSCSISIAAWEAAAHIESQTTVASVDPP